MPTDWWRVDVIIVVMTLALLGSLAGIAAMLMVTEADFDALFDGPAICFLPIAVATTVLSLAVIGSFIPYRGSGRKMFEVGWEAMTKAVEQYLEAQGLKAEKEDKVEEIRRSREHRTYYRFTLEGKHLFVLVRGREQGSGTAVFVTPWLKDEGFFEFVDGLERAIYG
jgi:hypothetical protein